MLTVFVYVIEVALNILERRRFFEFGILELIEGKVQTVLQDALEVVESNSLLFWVLAFL